MRPQVRDRLAALTPQAFGRSDHAVRRLAQEQALGLPDLPTTTIGSFPQTGEIRRARAAWTRGDLTDGAYEEFLRAETDRVVDLQEELGLDVLVHGEPERNDVVQCFAEQLDGSPSPRTAGCSPTVPAACDRRSLWSDVVRPAPITVPWSRYAATRTAKPVKGTLTGPVTILAWSFVRDDQPLGDTARQVALALREPLPLRTQDQPAHLGWSV